MAEGPSDTLTLLDDDFTHLSVEMSIPSANSLMSKSQYGQVVFHDLCEIYPTDSDIKCRYSLTDNIQPQLGDKIALFKVGWLSVSEYVTFEHAKIPNEADKQLSHVTFAANCLPKDTVDLYQLCYITCDNVVVGASVPFGFRKPHESEFIAVEDPSDPGLLVFRSRVTQLQEELNKVVKERDSMHEKNHTLEIELMSLKGELIKQTSEKDKLNEENKQLSDKLNDAMEQNKALEDKIMNNPLENKLAMMKEELISVEKEKNKIELALKEKLNEINVHCATVECLQQNKLAMMKEEMVSVEKEKNKIELALKEKLNEINVHCATVKCLQQDRKHVDENLREQLKANERLEEEKRSLEETIKELSEKHNIEVLGKLEISLELNDAKSLIHDLQVRLDEKEVLISKIRLGFEDIDSVKQALMKSEEEKTMLSASLINLQEHHSKCESKIAAFKESENSAYLCLQTELNKMSDQYTKNNLKFEEEKKSMQQVIEDLKKQLRSRTPPSFMSGSVGVSANGIEICTSSIPSKESTEPTGEKDDPEQLKSKLNGVLMERAGLRSQLIQVKHERDEIKKLLSRKNDEIANLNKKYEELKSQFDSVTSAPDSELSSSSISKSGCDSEKWVETKAEFVKFFETFEIAKKCNELVSEKSLFELQLEEERSQKYLLQKKVEDLMLKNSRMYSELYKARNNSAEENKIATNGESVETIKEALESACLTNETMSEELGALKIEKKMIENQLMNLRKESVGKVSLDDVQQLRDEIAALNKKLKQKECCAEADQKLKATMIQYETVLNALKRVAPGVAGEIMTSFEGVTKCPLCPALFMPRSFEAFNQHFESHT